MGSIQAAIFAAIFATGLAIGGTVAYKLQANKVTTLQLAIANANALGQQVLLEANKKVKLNEDAQAAKLTELETKHAESVNANIVLSNSLSTARAAYRLRTNNKPCSTNRVPKVGGAGVPEAASQTIDIPTGFDQVIDRDAAIADENTEYALRAYWWVQSLPPELKK